MAKLLKLSTAALGALLAITTVHGDATTLLGLEILLNAPHPAILVHQLRTNPRAGNAELIYKHCVTGTCDFIDNEGP